MAEIIKKLIFNLTISINKFRNSKRVNLLIYKNLKNRKEIFK